MSESDSQRLIGGATYLARRPERLVLEGYRGWTWSTALRSPDAWARACRFYGQDLGDEAEIVLEALDGFTATLGLCAACPLRMRCTDIPMVCRDEALVLALIAALQHADDEAAEMCLTSMCRPELAGRVGVAAGLFALMLKSVDRILIPIPPLVIAGIESRFQRTHGGGDGTLH